MMEFGSEIEAPKLDGTPNKYHVYIASNPKDVEMRKKIVKSLEGSEFFVYDDDDQVDTLKNIESGIHKSKKVLFLATKAYLEDYDLRTHQVNLAREKACAISPEDIIVVTGPNVDNQVVRTKIGDYRTHPYEDDFKLLHSLVAEEPQQSPDVRSNMGAAMAYSHYYGYLRIILPDMSKRIKDSQYMKGMENPNDRNMPKKFFIIVPESLHGPPSLKALDERITDIGKITFKAGRGGNVERDYSSFVHRIENSNAGSGDPKEYLFLGDIPNILINLYDMEKTGIRITESQKNLEVCQFYYYLQYLINNDPLCNGQVSFIYHADQNTRNYQQVGDIILEKIKDEIVADLAEEMNPSASSELTGDQVDLETVGKVDIGPLKVEYLSHPLQFYQMDQESVGRALIINNKKFDPAASLKERTGGEKDEESLVRLMTRLNFEVITYRDQSATQMVSLISHYADDEMHRNAQAFCCIIMTHGESGQLYGRDGKLINFVDLAEITGKCRALKNKPKLFFVEACQSSDHHHQVEKLECDTKSSINSEEELQRSRLTPSAADMIVSFSTLPGRSAYRDPHKGTLYVQALCSLIEEKSIGMDLEQILKLVASDVKAEIGRREPAGAGDVTPMQLPFFISTAEKRLGLCLARKK